MVEYDITNGKETWRIVHDWVKADFRKVTISSSKKLIKVFFSLSKNELRING